MDNKEELFKEIFEKIKEIDEIFQDYEISSLSEDCEEEECDLTDDEDIITVHNILKETHELLKNYE